MKKGLIVEVLAKNAKKIAMITINAQEIISKMEDALMIQ